MKTPLPLITNCNDCGACCQHMRSPPFVGSYLVNGEFVPSGEGDPYGDHASLSGAPQEARDTIIRGLADDRPDESPCSWFDPVTKGCRWWQFRPDVCRAFEVGGDSCRAARRRQGVDPRTVYRVSRGKLVKSNA